jgi:hypothetical protein
MNFLPLHKYSTTFFDHLTSHISSNQTLIDLIHAVSMEVHNWPPEKSGEGDYYTPWVSMLNRFAATFRTRFAETHPLALLRDFYFYRYDRNVQRKPSEVKLKLDVLGLPPPPLNQECRFCAAWEDLLIVGGCKLNGILDLTHRTASYARAVFSHQRRSALGLLHHASPTQRHDLCSIRSFWRRDVSGI